MNKEQTKSIELTAHEFGLVRVAIQVILEKVTSHYVHYEDMQSIQDKVTTILDGE